MSSKRVFIGSFVQAPALTGLFHRTKDTLRETGNFKWTRTPDNFHITFHFFGDMPVPEIKRLQKILAPILQKDYDIKIEITGIAYFKKKNKPAVLFAKVAPNPTLNKLYHEIQNILYQNKFIEEQKNRFTPHITFGRIKKVAPDFYQKIDELQLAESILTNISKVAIIESILSPNGALYKAV